MTKRSKVKLDENGQVVPKTPKVWEHNGQKVLFIHSRPRNENIDDNSLKALTGGFTIAYTFDTTEAGTRNVHYAYSRCHPKDAFVLDQARIKALSRLNSEHFSRLLSVPKEEDLYEAIVGHYYEERDAEEQERQRGYHKAA